MKKRMTRKQRHEAHNRLANRARKLETGCHLMLETETGYHSVAFIKGPRAFVQCAREANRLDGVGRPMLPKDGFFIIQPFDPNATKGGVIHELTKCGTWAVHKHISAAQLRQDGPEAR